MDLCWFCVSVGIPYDYKNYEVNMNDETVVDCTVVTNDSLQVLRRRSNAGISHRVGEAARSSGGQVRAKSPGIDPEQ